MKKFLLCAVLAVFASCAGEPARKTASPGNSSARTPEPFIITDYKNKAEGQFVPEWVSIYLEKGVDGVETLDAYRNRYVFIGRNEGTNFGALRQWNEGFSPELDFPRLAAARIENRFSVPYPDDEYGAFYVAMIRAASDAPWAGAVREDDFWIRRYYIPVEENAAGEETAETSARETWEFLILVTMDKALFASQLGDVFRSVTPNPRPSRDQTAAANRVKDRFFEGF